VKDVKKLIDQLASEPSTNGKLRILSAHRDDSKAFAFFRACLNSDKYGIKKVPPCKIGKGGVDISEACGLLSELASRKLTGGKAKDAVKAFLERCSEDEADVFFRMLVKFPNCGVNRMLCRSVWPESFPAEVLLCKAMPYSAKNIAAVKWPAVSQTKMDGARCLCFAESGKAVFKSSSGKEFTGLESMGAEILQAAGDGIVVDGELVCIDCGTVLSRKEGNGILNKSLHGTISAEEAAKVRFVIWDVIPIQEYETGIGSRKYIDTLKEMRHTFSGCSLVSVVDTRIAASKEEALAHFREMTKRGEEGTILKNAGMVWEGKRSKNCVKFKIVIENTLKVVEMIEGTGKYRGMLGAAVCESSDGIVKVGVGSGFSDEERRTLWEDRDALDRKSIFLEVKSNGLISTEDGEWSLFLPRCSEIRLDKTEADDFKTIEALSAGSSILESEGTAS